MVVGHSAPAINLSLQLFTLDTTTAPTPDVNK